MSGLENLKSAEDYEIEQLRNRFRNDLKNIRIKYERKRSDLKIRKYTSTFEEFVADLYT